MERKQENEVGDERVIYSGAHVTGMEGFFKSDIVSYSVLKENKREDERMLFKSKVVGLLLPTLRCIPLV